MRDVFSVDDCGERFNVIVSNPPYVPSGEKSSLSVSVEAYEPHVALFGKGEDGLGFYRLLAQRAKDWLISGGTLLVECGHDQAEQVHAIFHASGLIQLTITKDLSGIPRVVSGRLL
jgi:release factor glutamine methyltransferase